MTPPALIGDPWVVGEREEGPAMVGAMPQRTRDLPPALLAEALAELRAECGQATNQGPTDCNGTGRVKLEGVRE